MLEPLRRFLVEFSACGNRPGSVRSYAYDLLRWWRWLRVIEVPWDRATPDDAREYALWLGLAAKPGAGARTTSAVTAGTINPITRKQYLDDRYQPRTVRHAHAVLRTFYDYWAGRGEGRVLNPIQRASRGRRPNEHHNPMEPFRAERRLRYNPPVPRRRPRTLTDDQWRDVFAALRSHRDRALLALAVSNGARAGELLGLRGVDIDWVSSWWAAGPGGAQGHPGRAVVAGQRRGLRLVALSSRGGLDRAEQADLADHTASGSRCRLGLAAADL